VRRGQGFEERKGNRKKPIKGRKRREKTKKMVD
jgi:hypothetical protein